MGNSKIVFGNEVLMDLTSDTVSAEKLLRGYTAHGADGDPVTGTCTFDSDTSDDTAFAAELLSGKTAHARGILITGEMPNIGAAQGIITEKTGVYNIAQGYHDGSGTVGIATVEQNKLIPENIKAGIVLLGITGTYAGEAVTVQSKIATPSRTQQVILPDSGYDYLSQVTVEAIPYVVTQNAAGGNTITIG